MKRHFWVMLIMIIPFIISCDKSDRHVPEETSLAPLRKVAEQGDAEAQYNLGLAYANGIGVAKDLEEAVKWYRKAAEQGDVQAQYYLGNAYGLGQGIAQDEEEAVKWLLKAAAQGHQDARFILEKMKGR